MLDMKTMGANHFGSLAIFTPALCPLLNNLPNGGQLTPHMVPDGEGFPLASKHPGIFEGHFLRF